MRTSIISQFFMFAIGATILGSVTAYTVANSDSAEIVLRKLEDALIENSTYLFQLQEMFFLQSESIKKKCHGVGVRIDVGELTFDLDSIYQYYPFYDCTDPFNEVPGCSGNWTTGLNYYYVCPDGPDEFQTSQILLGYYTPFLLRAFDPLIYFMITLSPGLSAQPKFSEKDCSTYLDEVEISLMLYVDKLDLLPTRHYDDIQRAEIALLSLVKGYARTKGHFAEIQYGDISTVTTIIGECYGEESTEFSVLVATFYFANTVILGLVTRYLSQSLRWLHAQDKQTKNMYAITAIVVMVVNCSSFIVRCTEFNRLGGVLYLDYFIIAVIPLILLLLVTEVPIVLYHTYKMRPTHKRKILVVFLHFSACCHIIWFIHSLVTDAIIATLNFVVSPAQTVGVVTIYLSVILGSIITLKGILNTCEQDPLQCSKNSFKQCLSLTCVLFTGVLAVALMISVSFLYIVLVRRGLSTAGAGGFLLSFAPPLVALVIGAYINRERIEKFFTSEDHSKHEGQNTSATVINMEDNVQELKEENELSNTLHTDKTPEAAQYGNSTQQQARFCTSSSSLVEPLLKESA